MRRNRLSQFVGCLFVLTVASEAAAQDRSLSLWLDQMRPELEKALGSPLPKPPRLGPVTADALPDPDSAVYLHSRFPHLQGDALIRAVADARAVHDAATVARYIEGTNVIQLRPENQKRIAAWNANLAATAEPEFLKLALVHELVKYALDARYNLRRHRQNCRDQEEWLAWQAIVEGRAQFVTRRLASTLGMERFFPLLAERFLCAPDVSPDPGLRTTSQAAMRQLHWAYTHGREFWQSMDQQRMQDIETRVFAKPPRLTAWIRNPELYLESLKSGRAELCQTIARLEHMLPQSEWKSAQQAWTPEMVRLLADKLGARELMEKRLEGWREGRTLIWARKDEPYRFVTLSVARFQNAAAAWAFLRCSLDLQRKMDQQVPDAHSTYRDVQVSGADISVMTERRSGQGGASAHSMLRSCVAEMFVEISWYGVPGEIGWAQAVLRAVTAK